MIRIRLRSRPWEIVEVHEHQLLDLQRWDSILEYVDSDELVETEDSLLPESGVVENEPESGERILTYEELQEYFKSSPE